MIEVNNLTSKKIDLNRVRSIILETLRLEKRVDDKEVSVAIVNSYEIEKINSKYRNINQSTDVLSFEGEDDILGEIIICPDEIQKNGENFDDELKRVSIHGTLHLLNYDHEKDQGAMIEKQEKYFSLIKK